MANVEYRGMLDRERAGIGGGHVLAASLAAAVSVLCHGMLAFVATRVDLRFASNASHVQPERQYPDLTLGSVDISESVQTEVLATLRELGEAPAPDVTQSVEAMQVAPEVGVTVPPVMKSVGDIPVDAAASIQDPEIAPMTDQWVPRQDILAIESVAVGDVLVGLERRVIPAIERIPRAPDIVLPASPAPAGTSPTDRFPVAAPSLASLLNRSIAPPPLAALDRQAPVMAERPPQRELFEETPEHITDVEPVERVLAARVEVFLDRRDQTFGYFRLIVERTGENLLPVRPKDVLLVQDGSASMAEQRMFFCREALRRALSMVGIGDRFNVASFADRTTLCFPDWVVKTPETLTQAEAFIDAMKATGNTDLFTSMQDLLNVSRLPGRPIIALLVTDGLVNKGMTDSTDIIGAFTRQNQGAISVFTTGVSSQANRYLIDLLSYCNGGAVQLIESGRWDIPPAIEEVMRSIQRPVLSDLSLRFGADSTIEVYPTHVGNLYLDRPMVVYGRYPLDVPVLVVQAVGQAGAMRCDMIFDLPLKATLADGERQFGDPAIREMWAQQKIYYLLSQYARMRDADLLKSIQQTGREYGLSVPYRRAIGL